METYTSSLWVSTASGPKYHNKEIKSGIKDEKVMANTFEHMKLIDDQAAAPTQSIEEWKYKHQVYGLVLQGELKTIIKQKKEMV